MSGALSAGGGNLLMRRGIILTVGVLASFVFGYLAAAVLGIAWLPLSAAGAAYALLAAGTWPRYPVVAWLGAGFIGLMTLATIAGLIMLIFACHNGECV